MAKDGDREGDKSVAARFRAALQQLVKTSCLFYDTGPPQSAMLDVHFGRLVPRRREGTAPAGRGNGEGGPATPGQEGELSLFVSCAWRLESTGEVLCGCWDDKEPDGQMRNGLDQLVGQHVRRLVAVPPAWDVAIELENGLVLRVFCDQTNDQEGADNYSLFTPERVFTVGTLSELYDESRE